jgi:hypothetical protein
MSRSSRLPRVTVALVALAACDSQVPPSYLGEPLVRLHGTASADDALPPGVSAELHWIIFFPSIPEDRNHYAAGYASLGTRGEFPARIVIEVYNYPLEIWLNDFTRGGELPDESMIGLAEFRESGEQDDLRSPPGSYWFSFSRQVLVYVDRDILPGTVSATFVGAALPAGFHVLEVMDAPCDSFLPANDPMEGRLDCLRPAPGGLDTEVNLRFVRYIVDEGLSAEEEAAREALFFADFPHLYPRAGD